MNYLPIKLLAKLPLKLSNRIRPNKTVYFQEVHQWRFGEGRELYATSCLNTAAYELILIWDGEKWINEKTTKEENCFVGY